jgi:hypothetical protein
LTLSLNELLSPSICVVVCALLVVSSLEDIVTTEMALLFLGDNNLTVPGWCPVKPGIVAAAGGTVAVIAP